MAYLLYNPVVSFSNHKDSATEYNNLTQVLAQAHSESYTHIVKYKQGCYSSLGCPDK